MFTSDKFASIEDAAAKLAGNHRRFEAFYWRGQPDDAEKWTIIYTHNRDSELMDESNAAAIAEILEVPAFEHDVTAEDHSHWAVGWVKGYAVRVYDAAGAITPAFRALWGIAERLAGYPVLDEDDLSRREAEQATDADMEADENA